MVNVSIKTFGCKVNQYNSELLLENLLSSGQFTHNSSQSENLMIINSCVVTERSEKDVVRLCRKIKRKETKIIVFGCLSPKLKNLLVDLDILFFPNQQEVLKQLSLENGSHFHSFSTIHQFKDRTRAFVKIQTGCNQFCSYCIIPMVRGKIENRPLKEIIKEIKQLIITGYKEIILTGTQIGLYQDDETKNFGLLQLFQELETNFTQDLYRIRISSIGPTFINNEMISFLAGSKLFCNHLHVSLQSGSNKILQLMNRKYTAEYFIQLAEKLRNSRKDFCLSTDVIVGFPGESDQDFQDTMEICKEVKFSKIHVFPFSGREGTKAFCYKNLVIPDVLKKRTNELLELSKIISYNVKREFIGKKVKVLIEEDSSGFTDNYLRVVLQKGRNRKGQLASVIISRCDAEALYE